MNKRIADALGLAGIAVLALAVWGAFGITNHLIVALDAWKSAAPNLQPTLDAISGPRGTLHNVDKAVVKIGDAITTTQLQERAIAPHTIAAVDSLATIAPHVNQAVDAASGTAQEATATLKTADTSIAAAQPLLASLTRTSDASTLAIAHFDALVQSKDLADALANVQVTTQNVAGVTGDFERVTHKAADDYVRPKTPWQRIGQMSLDAWDISALFARHY